MRYQYDDALIEERLKETSVFALSKELSIPYLTLIGHMHRQGMKTSKRFKVNTSVGGESYELLGSVYRTYASHNIVLERRIKILQLQQMQLNRMISRSQYTRPQSAIDLIRRYNILATKIFNTENVIIHNKNIIQGITKIRQHIRMLFYNGIPQETLAETRKRMLKNLLENVE